MIRAAKFVRTQLIHALPRLPLQIGASVAAIMLASWFTQPTPKTVEPASAEILTVGSWQVATVNRAAKTDRLPTPPSETVAETIAAPAAKSAPVQKAVFVAPVRSDTAKAAPIPPRPVPRPCTDDCVLPVAAMPYDATAIPAVMFEPDPEPDDRSMLRRTSERVVAALTDLPLVDRLFR
ncbi:hypothetical protein OSH11_05245 [Kaistia dalseonensis]|uniref:Uncharacterized protein n=1 Tax=Kaistia dalseonensis TaxID=410840 RepID=A0ABU0H2Z1_9HYPH|nr:hypothetical protein [Kaistia dalseonensis]MCX5494093.1 hypothetical protein [Kaistia dalseonensis]MDQ0436672.1 hypothetical protein [Kaistia dalseonensis]